MVRPDAPGEPGRAQGAAALVPPAPTLPIMESFLSLPRGS